MGVINRTLLYGEGLFETIKLPSTEERLKLHYGEAKKFRRVLWNSMSKL
jgi:hypothetical protein